MLQRAFVQSEIPGLSPRRGKVRDLYDLGDRLLLVSTDRVSAFDWVLPTGIPDKGRVLNQLSVFWFRELGVPNHLITSELESVPLPPGTDVASLQGRSMVVRKLHMVPFECVARGYLAGSGWKDYRRTGALCGEVLPPGLVECGPLPRPLFTPATKAEHGHDENVTFDTMSREIGTELAGRLRALTLEVYGRGAALAMERGMIIADTKLEWGLHDGEILLADEVLTPDSSRFWPREHYQPGRPQESFDKQLIRDWLEQSGWDKASPPPPLPDDVVARTRHKYLEAYERLVGQALR